MSGHFNEPDGDDDMDAGDDEVGIYMVHADDDGHPCFGCFFDALVASFGDDQVVPRGMPDGLLTQQDLDEVACFTAALKTVAEGMVGVAIRDFEDEAVGVLEFFAEQLVQLARLYAAPVTGPAN